LVWRGKHSNVPDVFVAGAGTPTYFPVTTGTSVDAYVHLDWMQIKNFGLDLGKGKRTNCRQNADKKLFRRQNDSKSKRTNS
jgi:hypothetical protein